jgi:hypothetical protein
VNLRCIVPLQPDGQLLKAFRRVRDDFAPEFSVWEQQGDIQLGFGNINSENAHLTDTHDKTSCTLNLANAGFRRGRAIDTVQVPAGKTGETGALSTLRASTLKGRCGIRLSFHQDGLC